MSWECAKCGSCCKILPRLLFKKDCKEYDKEKKLCSIYDSRPDICIAKHEFGKDFTQRCCEALRDRRSHDNV